MLTHSFLGTHHAPHGGFRFAAPTLLWMDQSSVDWNFITQCLLKAANSLRPGFDVDQPVMRGSWATWPDLWRSREGTRIPDVGGPQRVRRFLLLGGWDFFETRRLL